MIKILFVCHGNICRSPMAEFLMKNMVNDLNIADRFIIASAATSTEEIGNPVHYGTRNKLRELGIDSSGKKAVLMKKSDYAAYDYLLGMDEWNIRNMRRIAGGDPQGKIFRLLDFTDRAGADIADPWYTGNFEETYRDIMEGLNGFMKFLDNPSAHPQKKGVLKKIVDKRGIIVYSSFINEIISFLLFRVTESKDSVKSRQPPSRKVPS